MYTLNHESTKNFHYMCFVIKDLANDLRFVYKKNWDLEKNDLRFGLVPAHESGTFCMLHCER